MPGPGGAFGGVGLGSPGRIGIGFSGRTGISLGSVGCSADLGAGSSGIGGRGISVLLGTQSLARLGLPPQRRPSRPARQRPTTPERPIHRRSGAPSPVPRSLSSAGFDRGECDIHCVARIGFGRVEGRGWCGYAMRTYSGRPSSSIRFSAWTATAASVARRASVRDRSVPPITRLYRLMSASTSAR